MYNIELIVQHLCSQTGGKVGDTETATAVDAAAGIQYVTEQNNNNEDRPEFRVSNLHFFVFLNRLFRWRSVIF